LEDYPEPENGEPAAMAAVQMTRNGIIRNDKKCKSQIVKRIQDTQLKFVKGQESCYDVWKSLQDVFEKKGMKSRAMLKTKLLSLKHQPSVEILSEHILKCDKIIRELEETGCIMNESDKVCHLSGSGFLPNTTLF
jgi:hypothetical protein